MQKESKLNVEKIEPLNIIHFNPILKINYQFNINEKYEKVNFLKQII